MLGAEEEKEKVLEDGRFYMACLNEDISQYEFDKIYFFEENVFDTPDYILFATEDRAIKWIKEENLKLEKEAKTSWLKRLFWDLI
ncbi:hypothetical protein PRVXH_002656 [Proteinivorax hydrogeniformans]|uniref:Uncharacterized protein n=1 Tax=Proteinivorax hydrogeniformans TaxID=1826727 RepID=A0AAU8HSY6_9FIRM